MKVDKNKPLIDMSPGELKQAFEEVGESTDRLLLEEARTDCMSEFVIAAAILHTRDSAKHVALWVPEYGDHEGINHIKEFIATCQRRKYLYPGETLTFQMFKFDFTKGERTCTQHHTSQIFS